MKTLEYVLDKFKSKCIDGRDAYRLATYTPEEKLKKIGISLKEEYVGMHETEQFTKDSIIKQLKRDVEFGWGKAVNQRGISSETMYEVVKMWNWILENDLEGFDDYGSYGKPLFIATAEKYGWKLP